MSNIQAIKAELYDLQWHNCDGQFTVRADGHFDSDDESCEACSRILLLQNRLQDAVAQKGCTRWGPPHLVPTNPGCTRDNRSER